MARQRHKAATDLHRRHADLVRGHIEIDGKIGGRLVDQFLHARGAGIDQRIDIRRRLRAEGQAVGGLTALDDPIDVDEVAIDRDAVAIEAHGRRLFGQHGGNPRCRGRHHIRCRHGRATAGRRVIDARRHRIPCRIRRTAHGVARRINRYRARSGQRYRMRLQRCIDVDVAGAIRCLRDRYRPIQIENAGAAIRRRHHRDIRPGDIGCVDGIVRVDVEGVGNRHGGQCGRCTAGHIRQIEPGGSCRHARGIVERGIVGVGIVRVNLIQTAICRAQLAIEIQTTVVGRNIDAKNIKIGDGIICDGHAGIAGRDERACALQFGRAHIDQPGIRPNRIDRHGQDRG